MRELVDESIGRVNRACVCLSACPLERFGPVELFGFFDFVRLQLAIER